jgi:serine/threonine-protein kinase
MVGPDLPTELLLWVLGVAVGGGLLGYLLATQLMFPAAEPPQDLLTVPDLRGQEVESARTLAGEAGLAVGRIEYLTHPVADSGSVLGQSPLPGQLAVPGDSIRITLSLGPERRRVPEVTRLRADRAVAMLQATGFTVQVDSVESREPRGRILRVVPDEGEELTLPGDVAVQVSLGPPAVMMPDLLRMAEDQARDTLTALGLVVSEVEEVFRFGRDQGRVVAQDPPAGFELERGSAVRLTVGRRSGGLQDH